MASAAVSEARLREYWRKTLALTAALFAAWTVIAVWVHLAAPVLKNVELGGMPLHWLMAKISIIIGILLIFGYAFAMKRIEDSVKRHA